MSAHKTGQSRRLRWKAQAVLASALLGLGAAAFWLEYRYRPDQEAKEDQDKKVWNLKDRQIRSIRLQGLLTTALSCTEIEQKLCKTGDSSKWELTVPQRLKADDSNVSSLVSTLANLSAQETIDLSQDKPERRAQLLKEYGLDEASRKNPRLQSVTIQTDQETRRVGLGTTHPIGDGWFALSEKDGKWDETRVLVLPAHFKGQLDHDLTYWRDKKVLVLETHQIQSISLARGKAGPISLERIDGQWRLTAAKGEAFPGDPEAVDQMLNGLSYLQAKGFSDRKSLAKARLALEVRLSTRSSPPKPDTVLSFFAMGDLRKGSAGKLYVTVSGQDPVYELEAFALDRVNKDVKDLRLAKLLTSMDRFGAQKISWKTSGEENSTLTVVREGTQWLLEGGRQEADSEKIGLILDQLSGNRVRGYLKPSATPAKGKESLGVQIYNDKGELKRNLEFWKSAQGNGVYARDILSDRTEVLELDSAMANQLPWKLKSLEKSGTP